MIRIFPIGGIGKVTNNMYVYEYLKNGLEERIIIDCGIGFPEQEMLGADLFVPDISYLKGKEKTILGIILTHAHDDHIAGLPYILPQLNAEIPIFASALTAGFAQSNLKDFGINQQIKIIEDNEIIRLGNFEIDPVKITHSVPNSKHFVITTPDGIIYHGSDFKFDWTPVDGIKPDLQKMAYYGYRGIDLLLTDCLRVENDGYSLSETKVGDSLRREFKDVTGKVIITTMSSNIHRIQQAIEAAIEHRRKIAFLGYSIEENTKIAQRLNFLNVPEKFVVDKKRIKDTPANELCLIVAGCQGQVGSSLERAAKNNHDLLKIKPGDRVVFSADPIPGNEANVYKMIDNLAKLGATLSYREIQDDLHVSGHASSEELRLLLTLLKPGFVMPIGGTFRHMNQFKVLAKGMGFDDGRIFLLELGDILALDNKRAWVDDRVKLKTVIVDGLGIGDVGPLILSDRQQMSQNGMVVIAVPTNKEKTEITGDPEVVTRGFVFAKTSQDLLEEIKNEIRDFLPRGKQITNWKEQREELNNRISKFIFEKTQREPLILIALVGV